MISPNKVNRDVSPFETENLRDSLALNKDYRRFKKTYKIQNLGIRDENSPLLWDKLNNRGFTSNKENPMAVHRIDIVCRNIDFKSTDRVLDIGFGAGDLEKKALDRNQTLDWYGIDISRKSVLRMNQKFPNATFKVGSIYSLKFKNNCFDYVICLEVMEHLHPFKTYKALKEILRVLKKRGTLIVSVPLNEDLKGLLANGSNPNAHLRTYTSEILKAELITSGFEILKLKYLYAFRASYTIKTILVNLFRYSKRPNNVIIVARKR